MPTTIVAVIVILFVLLPGYPAYQLYKRLIGNNWRETEWEGIVRIIGFSVGGIILYSVISAIFSFYPPIYVVPSTFSEITFSISTLFPIAVSFIGHTVGSFIIAIVIAYVQIVILSRVVEDSPYPASWDDFIRHDVANHWVVISLTNGQTYAGMIKNTDISVKQEERDIVLLEPAIYLEIEDNYKVLPFQTIFIKSSLVNSIATYSKIGEDIRCTKIGSYLFQKEENNESGRKTTKTDRATTRRKRGQIKR